ncbi:MAG TPA: hypothetical protein V6C81_06560 [Planktothrix sp.]|jgi:hypothetical protein
MSKKKHGSDKRNLDAEQRHALEARILRNLHWKNAEEGAATARTDFDKSSLAAVYVAMALLDDAIARKERLTASGLAYVREIFDLVGLPRTDTTDPMQLTALMLAIKPLVSDEQTFKKQISNWRARRLLQIT